MYEKRVCIEYAIAASGEKSAACDTLIQKFQQAAGHSTDCKFHKEEHKISISFPHAEFVRLMRDGKTFSARVIDAFRKADMRMSKADREHSGFFSRLTEAICLHKQIKAGEPTMVCAESISGE